MATAAEAEQAKRARKRARKQARRADGGANFPAKKAKLVDAQAAANVPAKATLGDRDAAAAAGTAYLVDHDITIHEAGAPPPCLAQRPLRWEVVVQPATEHGFFFFPPCVMQC